MSFPYRGAAVITGAGSGIGRATARALAAKGMDLALVDLREDRLEEVRSELASNVVKVTTYAVDVADKEAVRALPEAVSSDHPVVSILMNNAGVGLGGTFEQVCEDDFDWLMDVNFNAVVRLTRGFLPLLKAAPRARIVNISSIFGIIAPATQVAYASSKFAVRGFSESLRHELEGQGASVGVTVVHPGGVATNISTDARINVPGFTEEQARERKEAASRLLTLPPDEAARQIVSAIEGGRPRLLIGKDARGAALLQRLFPVTYYRYMANRLAKAT